MTLKINRQSQAAVVAAESPRQRERRNGVTHVPIWVCHLRALRDQHNLSMDKVADGVGLSKNAYWKIEHGGDVRLTSARRIADFFGKRIEAIWPEVFGD